MDNLKTYLLIGMSIIICVLFLKIGCVNPPPNLEVAPQVKIEHHFHSDTIFTNTETVKFKQITKFKTDTIFKLDTVLEDISTDNLFFVRHYNDSIDDSTLTIHYKMKVIGLMSNMDLSYNMKRKPLLITNDSVITKTVYYPIETRLSLFSGLSLIGNKSSMDIAPYISLNIKNNNFTYSYHILNNVHQLGIGVKLYNSKK